VVEVAVRDEQSANLVASLFKIAGIRKNVVDTRCVVFGERESCIENKDVVADFDRGHVATDFFHAAERNNAHDVILWWGHHLARLFIAAGGLLMFNLRASSRWSRWAR
jgi:hypothetical protein